MTSCVAMSYISARGQLTNASINSSLERKLTIKHPPNGQRPKRRHQNPVRNSPILLPWIISREQTIVNTIPDLLQSPGNHLSEALLVKNLIGKFMAADEDP